MSVNARDVMVNGFSPLWLDERCAYLRANPAKITNTNLDIWLALRGTSVRAICAGMADGTEAKLRGLVAWFRKNPDQLTPMGLLGRLESLKISFGGGLSPTFNSGEWWPRPNRLQEKVLNLERLRPMAIYPDTRDLTLFIVLWWERMFRKVLLKNLATVKSSFDYTYATYFKPMVDSGRCTMGAFGAGKQTCRYSILTTANTAWQVGVPPMMITDVQYDGGNTYPLKSWRRFYQATGINSMAEWVDKMKAGLVWGPENMSVTPSESLIDWQYLPIITIDK